MISQYKLRKLLRAVHAWEITIADAIKEFNKANGKDGSVKDKYKPEYDYQI